MGCWLTLTQFHGFRHRLFRAARWRLPTPENGQSAACLAVANCSEPVRRSRTFGELEWSRHDGMFRPTPHFDGLPTSRDGRLQTGPTEPLPRELRPSDDATMSRFPLHAGRLTNRPTEQAAGDPELFRTARPSRRVPHCTACRHQRIVKVPYSNPAQSTTELTDWTTHWRTARAAVYPTVCCLLRRIE